MDELISIMADIRDLLQSIDGKLDDLKFSLETDITSAISDVSNQVKEISCMGVYTLSDVCSHLSDIDISLNSQF